MARKSSTLVAMALWMTHCAWAGDLGRLFTTPQERSSLNGEDARGSVRPAVKLQGILLRHGGAPVAWVNDRPLGRGDYGNGFFVLDVDANGALILHEDRAPPAEPTP